MKIVNRKLNRYNDISDILKITSENLPEEHTEFEPNVGSIELESALKDGEGGLRVVWQKYNAIVEEKIDGEWVPVTGIQKLSIEFDVEKALPIVKMERIVF